MKTMKFEVQYIYQEAFLTLLQDLKLEPKLVLTDKGIFTIEVKYSWLKIPVVRTIKKILSGKFLPTVGVSITSEIDRNIQEHLRIIRKEEQEEQARSDAEFERLTKLKREIEERNKKRAEESAEANRIIQARWNRYK